MEIEFEEIYGVKPLYRIKCPGRVNLIGGSIDYNGYGVLPMAIDLNIELLVVPTTQSRIEFQNCQPDKYKPFSMPLPSQWNGASPPEWFDYLLCGWKGVLEAIQQPPRGMLILVKGTIPPSSGLSSSSALVCAAALATLVLHTGHGFTSMHNKKWLADLCAKAEHMIGTCGGGMDQACEILAEDGAALHIDFNPLTTRSVKLPGNALFVVLHSGDYLNKASSSQYNERVIECRVAAQFLGKFLELPNWKSMRRLREIQEKSGKTLEELLQLVKTVIPENATAEEVIAEIGKDSFTALLTENTKHMKEFNLRPRASHCFGEAKRVNDFEEACKREDLTAMGQLMNQSHKSLQENYQNTSPGIDKLINECKKANVLGVRMTGGGWGGCLVALLDKNNPIDLSQLNVLFNSSPCQGITFEELYDQK